MALRNISIEEKIAQQKEIVSKFKDKYDVAVAELERLMQKREDIRNKELLDAFSDSDRRFEEVMLFLASKEQ